jgi:hypothetical protein
MVSINLNFDYALKNITSEEYTNKIPVPEPAGCKNYKNIYNQSYAELKEFLKNISENHTEEPIIKELYKIDVPKPNFAIRPMGRPEIKEWIIYESIVENISRKILEDETICKRCFSILSFRNRKTKKIEPWLKFKDEEQRFYDEGYKYVVISDITGFYENIRLEELRSRTIDYLNPSNDETYLIDVLFALLRNWSSERIEGYGLPQGTNASRFLSDIYIDIIDRKMEKYEGYFRYGDDVRIFCKHEIEAKKALKDLIIALRDLKLNINAKKTGIFFEEQIADKLFDPQKPLINMIENTIKSKNKKYIETSIPQLIKLFENSFSENNQFAKTHMRYSLFRLSLLKHNRFKFNPEKIIKLIKLNFVGNPNHADLFCQFLSLFPKKSTLNFFINFLKSDDNIYEWQELKILQTLLNLNIVFRQDIIEFFIESAKDSNKHDSVRAFYILLAGKQGKNRDRTTLMDYYEHSFNNYLKKAIILAVQESGVGTRNDFYNNVKRMADNEIKQLIKYLKSINQPVYYPKTDLPNLDVYDY